MAHRLFVLLNSRLASHKEEEEDIAPPATLSGMSVSAAERRGNTLKRFSGPFRESQGYSLALIVLYVPYSLDSDPAEAAPLA